MATCYPSAEVNNSLASSHLQQYLNIFHNHDFLEYSVWYDYTIKCQ